ncbi:MAG: hypothetical protein AB7Q42_19490 [Acidimicrobiia bacterium]
MVPTHSDLRWDGEHGQRRAQTFDGTGAHRRSRGELAVRGAGQWPTRTVVTFEFGHLLDPIGPEQAPGASRSAPADAVTPAPAGSNHTRDETATSFDADAWLLDLLTEPGPATASDLTMLDELVAVADPEPAAGCEPETLPAPMPGTLVSDLPPPGTPPESPSAVVTSSIAVPDESAAAEVPTPAPTSGAVVATPEVSRVPDAAVAPEVRRVPDAVVTSDVIGRMPDAAVAPQPTPTTNVEQARSRFAGSDTDDDRLPARRRRR